MIDEKECPRTSERVASIDAKLLARKNTPRTFKSVVASSLRLRQKTKRCNIRSGSR